jgi:STAS domain
MLKVQRSANGQVVFTLSGRMDEENTAELETLIRSEEKGRPIVLDLKDVTLVNQDAVSFLERCEADSITLQNCPGYIREWIKRQRRGDE